MQTILPSASVPLGNGTHMTAANTTPRSDHSGLMLWWWWNPRGNPEDAAVAMELAKARPTKVAFYGKGVEFCSTESGCCNWKISLLYQTQSLRSQVVAILSDTCFWGTNCSAIHD